MLPALRVWPTSHGLLKPVSQTALPTNGSNLQPIDRFLANETEIFTRVSGHRLAPKASDRAVTRPTHASLCMRLLGVPVASSLLAYWSLLVALRRLLLLTHGSMDLTESLRTISTYSMSFSTCLSWLIPVSLRASFNFIQSRFVP